MTASISHHRMKCEECNDTLQTFESLDERLSQQIRDLELAPVANKSAPDWSRRALTAIVPVAVIIAIVAVAGLTTAVLAGTFLSSGTTPLYAASPTAERGEEGWIVYGTWDGGLHAFDPVTGEREILLPEYFTAHIQDGANYLVSPDGERVAIFSQNDVPGLHWATRRIRVVEITGETVSEIEWHHEQEAGWPTGWLGNDEIVISSIPVYQTGESNEQFFERLETEGHLRAVNVETGEQRTVYEGAVAQVVPSPDATRLAIVRPREPSEPGTSVEIWSVENGEAVEYLGGIDHRFTWTGGLLWSPDSRALYAGHIDDFEDQRDEQSRDDTFRGKITSVNLMAIDRDGSTEALTPSASGTGIRIAGFIDDGDTIVYTQFPMDGDEDDLHTIHHFDQTTGDVTTIDLPIDELQFRPTQAGTLGYQTGFVGKPDSAGFMIHLATSHYLRADPAHHVVDPPEAIYLTMFDERLEAKISTMISDRWPLTPLGWLPADRIAPAAFPDIDHAASAQAPERVSEIRPYAQLGGDSTSSPDGSALPMVEAIDEGERPYLWFPIVETGRWIASETRDLSWHASSHGFLGVTELGGANGGMFRITQHNASQRGGSSIDGFFDPLRIDNEPNTRYAAPASSPDVTHTSFISIDEDRQRATLWIADWTGEMEDVYSHSFPERFAEEISPINVWIDNNSLMFVEHLEWSWGLPVHTALHRLDIAEDGSIEIVTVLELHAAGRDRGIDLVDLEIHPDGEYIAWRARHYTNSSDPSAGYDTVHLAPTSNLSESVEIDREMMSSGLSWSPGGQALALGSGERIGVYSTVSHNFAIVSDPYESTRFPAWLSENELWFNVGQQDNSNVFRVRFGD
jgi:hypothetical protein